MVILLVFCGAAFVLGIVLHVALYAPTSHLPPMWRNLARYFFGVAAVLVLIAVAIVLAPSMTLWHMYAIMLMLFAMTGLGVGMGYLLMND